MGSASRSIVVTALAMVLGTTVAHADARRARIEAALARGGPTQKLRKAELRPRLKTIVPRLTRCYAKALVKQPATTGVVNTSLTIRNEPKLGLTLTVNGFDTHGPLGESREFLACVTTTFEAAVLPPIKARGSLDILYPSTFATEPPGDKDIAVVDQAERSAKDGRWAQALEQAERGLELTSLDGPYRRRLIEVGGLAACAMKNEERARHYFALSSPGVEDRVHEACRRTAMDL